MIKPWLSRSRGFFLSNPHGVSALGVSMSILWTILIGFIAGVLAKLITPGSNEPQGSILTTILAPSARSTWDKRSAGIEPMRVRVVGAVIVLLVWAAVTRPRSVS
jgi:uncharacterized membrane protein YeaQ/YmgE (transglycosylase-associated protein family)